MTPNPLLDRYNSNPNADNPFGSGPGSSSPISSSGVDLGVPGFNPGAGNAPNSDAFREQYRGYAQATVNAIRSKYDQILSTDEEAKKKLETKSYLRALANGQASAPSGASQETAAADRGQKQISADIQAREAEVAQAFANADLRASADFEKRRTEYLASVKDVNTANETFSKTVKADAEKEIGAYASTYSYDDWAKQVGPDRLTQYMKETGRDENGLKAMFIAGAKNDLVSPSGTKLADGSVAFYKKTYDPSGNITGVTEVGRIPASADGKTIKDSRITDNGVQVLYTDGTYKEIGNPGNTPNNSPTKLTGVPAGFGTDDIEKGRELFKKFGKGGYAEPAFYVDAYQNWINQGGKDSKFLELYPPDEFVNPAEADLYPTYLRPKKVKVTVASTTTTPTPAGGRKF